MPKIIKDKNSGEYLNCFQSNADDKTLYENAAKLGRTDKENLVIEEVTKEEYIAILEQYKIDNPAPAKPRPKVTCPIDCGHIGGKEFDLPDSLEAAK